MKKKILKMASLFIMSLFIYGCSSFALSDCYGWIKELKLDDIENVYAYETYNNPTLIVDVYGSNNNQDVKKIYNFLKESKLNKISERKTDGTKISVIEVQTKYAVYEISFSNYSLYKDSKRYKLETNFPKLSNHAYQKFNYEHESLFLKRYDDILESEITDYNVFKFKIIDEFEYIDHTTDLVLSTNKSTDPIYCILDDTHFSVYNSSRNGYKVYELVSGQTFAEFIDKYKQEESYYTITLMDDDNELVRIRHDKNKELDVTDILYDIKYLDKDYKSLYYDKECTKKVNEFVLVSDVFMYVK